jgi:hypothetical protein
VTFSRRERRVLFIYCTQCHSNNLAEFNTEMIIHLSGMENIDNPGVLACPRVSVCLACGFSTFTVPEAGMLVLQEANAKALIKRPPGRSKSA